MRTLPPRVACLILLLSSMVRAQFPPTIDLGKFAEDVRLIYKTEDDYDDFGADLAVGDFNADGVNDILAGAYAYSEREVFRFAIGRAYVIFGPIVSSLIDLRKTGVHWVRITGDDPRDNTGSYVGAGDVNGDGITDAIIGGFPLGQVTTPGKLYIVYGRKNWPKEIDLNTDGGAVAGVTRINGKQLEDFFGGIAAGGDLNGDSYDDVLISASNLGEAYILYGRDSLDAIVDMNTTSHRLTTFHETDEWHIFSLGLFTDFDGDGYSDVFLGNTIFRQTDHQGPSEGAALIFYGSEEGLPADISLDPQSLANTGATFILGDEGRQLGRRFAVGDVNGNGQNDLLTCDIRTNRIYVLFDLPARTPFISMKEYTNKLELYQRGEFGDLAVANVNGDGFDDWITASPNKRGVGYILFGAESLPDFLNLQYPSQLLLSTKILAAQESYTLGESIATGDMNSDGLPDIIISDPHAHTIGGASPGEIYIIYGRTRQSQPPSVEAPQILQNYPNPFNATTIIRYSLDRAQHVRMAIYNSRGQKVRQLVEGGRLAGEYKAIWDGYDANFQQVGSGVYFCRIVGETFAHSIKLLYLK
ncbi:MAG: T9SS type A sorting domain-containing protein [Aliifodinibius sp.]|nr:T9SS type A sorting domain-containing protein [Fodinibius sp.]NIY25165.1 T9SS type A sorting domain-containing protein [Fodinibius sp.]